MQKSPPEEGEKIKTHWRLNRLILRKDKGSHRERFEYRVISIVRYAKIGKSVY